MEEKKAKDKTRKIIKTTFILIATASFAYAVYKYSGGKNFFKSHFGYFG